MEQILSANEIMTANIFGVNILTIKILNIRMKVKVIQKNI